MNENRLSEGFEIYPSPPENGKITVEICIPVRPMLKIMYMKGSASQSKGNNNQPGDLPAAIGQPATRALHGAGYTRLQQLTKVSEQEILQLHGVGPKAIRILKEALQEKGLTFAKTKK